MPVVFTLSAFFFFSFYYSSFHIPRIAVKCIRPDCKWREVKEHTLCSNSLGDWSPSEYLYALVPRNVLFAQRRVARLNLTRHAAATAICSRGSRGGGGFELDEVSSAMSVPGAFACLRLVLQSLCDFFPLSAGTLLDLSDWAFFVCR